MENSEQIVNYRKAQIDGLNIFYREAGNKSNPAIVLLHGFPSSSHMYRDLIPKLADRFHVIAPDYPGFGFSDAPTVSEFEYTFDNLTSVVDKFLEQQGIGKYILYMQDYGGPVGFRIAAKHPERVAGLIVQNSNAYVEGISAAFEPMQAFWANRTAETEAPARGLLTKETTYFQYTHGAEFPERVSPDAYTFDQIFLDRAGNDEIQLALLHNYTSNVALYDAWHEYFRAHQPKTLIVSGKNDPFFIPPGQEAFKRDLPDAEINLLEGGHFVLEEKSQEIAAHIRRFFTSYKEQSQ